MASIDVFNLGGLNLFVNPLSLNEGDLIRSVNVDDFPYGGKIKRSGYITYGGTANGSAVDSLLNYTQNDGTTFWNYRVSGGIMYYSTNGTGAWTICGNGTFTAGNRVRGAILENTLIVGDGAAATRHTTNGTSFTNTTSAPIAAYFEEYQNRIYAGGTASTLFWSTAGTPTSWTGADSSSINIPGAGRINSVTKTADRVVSSKNSGLMFKYDGYSLIDTATKLGLTSPDSYAKIEGFALWLNRLGFFGSGGGAPQLLSNAIQRQIYNDSNEGIAGSNFETAPAVIHHYDYLCAVGSVTDDLTDETVPDCVEKYNYQQNRWGNYQYANNPTAWLSFKDNTGVQQLIFGAANGQCYQISGTATNDNGSTIESIMEFFVHGRAPSKDKKWNWFVGFFNPGCQAHVQAACSDTFVKGGKNWIDLGDARTGVVEYRFPEGTRSKFLFIKITEASRNARFNLYGFSYDFDIIDPR